jgi:hypothetical protein
MAVAARFGVWDFSLFARNYKAIYGETPSTTLKRPASPRDCRHAMTNRGSGLRLASFSTDSPMFRIIFQAHTLTRSLRALPST